MVSNIKLDDRHCIFLFFVSCFSLQGLGCVGGVQFHAMKISDWSFSLCT